MAKIKIIGSGHLAHAIAKLSKLNHLQETDEFMVLTRSAGKINHRLYDCPIRQLHRVELLNSDIVIVAIPAEKAVEWVEKNQENLANKIVVDCSNQVGNGKQINQLLKAQNSKVVKAFTKINVFHILDDAFSVTETSAEMPIASDDMEALSQVSDLISKLGFQPKLFRSLEISSQMEEKNFEYFTKWQVPIIFSGFVWLGFNLYAIFERNILAGHTFFFQLLQNINVAFSSTSLALFGVVYGLGAYAIFKQHITGKKISAESDPTLVKLLNWRKQLGLVAMFDLLGHLIISLLLFGSSYYKYFSDPTGIILTAAISLLCGIVSYLIFTVTGITSLPSVGQDLGMMEWRTVQSYLGWGAMLLAVAHVAFMGFGSLLITTAGGLTLPSTFLLSIIIPSVAIFQKAINLLIESFQIIKQEMKQPTEVNKEGFTLSDNYQHVGLFASTQKNNGEPDRFLMPTMEIRGGC